VGVTGVAVLPHGDVGGAFAHHDALVGGDVELEGAGIVLVSLVVNLNLGQVVALEEFVDVGLIVDGTEPAGAAGVEGGAVAVGPERVEGGPVHVRRGAVAEVHAEAPAQELNGGEVSQGGSRGGGSPGDGRGERLERVGVGVQGDACRASHAKGAGGHQR